ncbi:hypothetical protein CFIO01_06312 [Colletotrichum fioriniae PJ7]|uniref:Uncharacterized protein n=1 Tax=Colletotrichum fioriniae PJ7 TaxID=1445577 RepID=A0A010R5T7_9PEZI|nr:hypothetical protein CFIO01_06312 [Colletotrichum fioriniae PJ7]
MRTTAASILESQILAIGRDRGIDQVIPPKVSRQGTLTAGEALAALEMKQPTSHRNRSLTQRAGLHKGIDTPWAADRQRNICSGSTGYRLWNLLASPEHISNYRLLGLGNMHPTQITRCLPESRKVIRCRLDETNGRSDIHKHGAYTPGNRFDNATSVS